MDAKLARLWGSLVSGVLLADLLFFLLVEAASAGWFEAHPTIGVLVLAGLVFPAIVALGLAIAVLAKNRNISREARWCWAGALVIFSFLAAAALFLVWWWRWDQPFPLFGRRRAG